MSISKVTSPHSRNHHCRALGPQMQLVFVLALGVLLVSSVHGQVLEGQILLPDSLGPLTGATHVALDESPAHPRMFIGSGDADVLVVNSLTGARMARVETGPVKDLCYSPVRNKLYVSCANPYGFLVIDCSSYQVTKQLPMPYVTTGLIYNPLIDRIYCATWGMRVIDCATDSIVDSLPMYTKDAIFALDSIHNKLYIGATDTFRVLDCNNDSLVASLHGLRKAGAVCFAPSASDDRVYVAAGESLFALTADADTVVYRQRFDTLDPQLANDPTHNRVYYTYWGHAIALDCATDSILWSHELWAQAIGLEPDPEHDKLYLLLHGFGSGWPYVLDGATGQTMRQFRWSSDSSLYYSAAVRRVFFVSNGGEVVAIDCDSDTEAAATPLAANIADACLDSVHGKLYFSVGRSGVGVVDCAAGKVVRYVRASDRLRYLAYNARDAKLYCSSDNSIFVLDCQRDSVVKEIPVRAWTLNMDWNPDLNKLYALGEADTNGLIVIDCVGDTVVKKLELTSSRCSTLMCPELNQLWLIHGGYRVVDCRGDSFVGDTWRLAGSRAASYDSTARKAYIALDTAMYVVDVNTLIPIDSMGLPRPVNGWSRQVYCDSRAGKVYWMITGGAPPDDPDSAVAIDVQGDSTISTITVPAMSCGISDDRSGDYVYFAGYHEIAVVDARIDSVVSTVSHPVSTQFLFSNRATSRFYVVGLADNVIQVVYDSVIFAGLETAPGNPAQAALLQTLLNRGAPMRSPSDAVLFDASGRIAAILRTGPNDIGRLAPGVYFLRGPKTEDGGPDATVRKIVIAK